MKKQVKKTPKIFLHLPAYREPELIPTIKSAIENATDSNRLVFGICRQYNPEDEFDNIDKYREDSRFRILDMHYTYAKGLPYARALINELLLQDEEYILQLDSHHRFEKGWDEMLINWHTELEKTYPKPILTGYLPFYDPFQDPQGRVQEPWQQQFVCFYPHGTIFIRPGLLEGWKDFKKPVPSRFLSGHFDFARASWAKEIRHDPDIYFSGEELNLTVRSFTHGYDFFHPPKVVIWHATMREERSGKLVWDDQSKRGEDWFKNQHKAWKKIRNLLRTQKDEEVDLKNYDLGSSRTLKEFEEYAGFDFKSKKVDMYTYENKLPPNPPLLDQEDKEQRYRFSFYHLVNIVRENFPQKSYDFILVAYDDERGEAIKHDYIKGQRLDNFLNTSIPIHYEDYFLADKMPKKVVYWGYTHEGWAERIEIKL